MNSKNINSFTDNSDEISIKEMILKIQKAKRFLLSKWPIIVGFGMLGSMLGFTYACFKKPIYTATTTFVLEEEKGGSGGLASLAGLASIAGVDLGGSGGGIFQGDNILQLYKSRTMIEKTLFTKVDFEGKEELLINRYIDFKKLKERWAKSPGLRNIRFDNMDSSRFTRAQDSIIGMIVMDIDKNHLSVAKPDKKLSVIQADVKAEDEFFAKSFNEKIVMNVNEFYIQTKTKKSIDNVRILQHKTDSVRAVMNGAIYAAVAVADATPNLNVTRQVQRMVPAQKAQFSAETNKAILSSLVQNLEMSKMALLKETPLIQVIDEPIYPLKMDKFGKWKGIVLGGILAMFLTMIYLIIRKLLESL